jgi:predicted kinase
MNFTDSLMSNFEENLISEMFDSSIDKALAKGVNVLLDATHCRAEYAQHYIEKFGERASISFKIFEAETEELIARCDRRTKETGRFVPASVVKKMVSNLEEMKKNFDFSTRFAQKRYKEAVNQDNTLPKALICDLDGTLAILNARNPYDASTADKDELNTPVANIIKSCAKNGYKILLVSGREDKYREPTEKFLQKYEIPYNELFMRKEKDFRKDAVIKREIFDREIVGKYCIDFVLDDRNQVVEMWRNILNFTCLQVNFGDF